MKRFFLILISVYLLICISMMLSCEDKNETQFPEVMTITPQINHLYPIKHSSISSDGKYIATTDYTHIIIKEKSGSPVYHRLEIPSTIAGNIIKSMVFNKDNSKIKVYTTDYKMEYSLKTSSLIGMTKYKGRIPVDRKTDLVEVIPPQTRITALSITPDKEYILIADNSGRIIVWDVFSAKILTTIFNNKVPFIAIYLNPYQQKIQAVNHSATYYEWDISDMESPKLNTEINLTHTDRKISLVSISEGGRRFLVVEKDNISSTIRLFQKQENDIVNKSQSVLDKPIHDIDINYDGQLVAVVYKEGHLNSTGIVLLDENLTQTGFIETERTPYKISFGDDNYLTAIFNDNQEIKRYSTTVEPIILPFKSDYPVNLFDYCDNVFIMVNIYSEIILVNSYNPDNSFNLTFGGNDYYLYSTIDGVFTASHKDMVRGVQWLDIVPQSEWVDLYDYDEIEGRLVEYMGLVSDW